MINSKKRLGVMVLVLGATMATQAMAISRVETPGKSCAAIQSILSNQGAAILRYPSKQDASRTLYDRYVSDRRSCQLGQVTERATVPAADTPTCRVLKCNWADPDDKFIYKPFK